MAGSHLAAAAALFGVTADDLTPLGSFESDVYSFDGPHGPSILKVIAEEHRLPGQVTAEVDWLLALLEAGVSVAEPLEGVWGRHVEYLPEARRVVSAGIGSDVTTKRLLSGAEPVGKLSISTASPPG